METFLFHAFRVSFRLFGPDIHSCMTCASMQRRRSRKRKAKEAFEEYTDETILEDEDDDYGEAKPKRRRLKKVCCFCVSCYEQVQMTLLSFAGEEVR